MLLKIPNADDDKNNNDGSKVGDDWEEVDDRFSAPNRGPSRRQCSVLPLTAKKKASVAFEFPK